MHAQYRTKSFSNDELFETTRIRFVGGIVFLLMLILSVLIAAIWVYKWMGDEQSQPIAEMIISGERFFTSDEDVRQALLASGTLKTLMNQDINVLRTQIERLPWIKEVKLKKRWPNRLIINIEEYKPYVRWNKNYHLDIDANVFSIPAERTIKLPLAFLFGPDGKEKEALKGYMALQALFKNNQIVLMSANMSDRYSWLLSVVLTTNGQHQIVEVDLGRTDYIGRAQKFINIFRELEKTPEVSQNIRRIDLRYETGAAISWHTPADMKDTQ
ncbi:FtsQ-type POTRA domain-containing protein [Thorsellia anophelis]|uniref:Cell division protein FtsQ n=1 Tax=Thorsellia anophelis DSM 18579 TaxID=1123402 RepID=A0A1H9ZBG0_9GAMM|nr:FtsQ-type POTRA domain-containing protein [Thorsellia anophelis]SES78911.1 cell division protein FtsQ [Thorsellia anophelis DSM 18579]